MNRWVPPPVFSLLFRVGLLLGCLTPAAAQIAPTHISAAQVTAWFQGGSAVPAQAVRPVAPAPGGADPLAGVNPALGDPDDPTPPVLIVVQTPAIPGLTVLP